MIRAKQQFVGQLNPTDHNKLSAMKADEHVAETLANTCTPISSAAKQRSLEQRLKSLERSIAEYKLELKEAKEMAEFAACERDVLVDALREAEDTLAKERLLWTNQKCDYEQMLDALNAKYQRNHKIWLENDRKATQEIKALDDMVDSVIRIIDSQPFNVKHLPAIQRILALVKGDNSLNDVRASSGDRSSNNNS